MIGYSINCSWFIKLNSVQCTTQLHMYRSLPWRQPGFIHFLINGLGFQVVLIQRSQWSCSHPGFLTLRVTSASPRNRRFAPLGSSCIPTYCQVRAVDQFDRWRNSFWHLDLHWSCSNSRSRQVSKFLNKMHKNIYIRNNNCAGVKRL